MNNIKLVTDGNERILPESMESIDIHLPHNTNHYINIILPSGKIIVVSESVIDFFDETETLTKIYSLNDVK